MITINGEKFENFDGKTVSEVIELKKYKTVFVAVEINGTIIKKSEYDKTVLNDGDEMEVVSFVGGG